MAYKDQIIKLKRLNKIQRAKYIELKETLKAIQNGEVDALVVNGPTGERIFALQSPEQPYRELVEAMNEGALTVSLDGIILYCNTRFETMTKVPHGRLVGSDFAEHTRPESLRDVQILLQRSQSTPSTCEVFLDVENQHSLPVQLSVSAIEILNSEGFCIIATDLSAQKQSAVLIQQQEWLTNILSLLPVPLVLLDSDLKKFSFINAKATEVLEGAVVKDKNQISIDSNSHAFLATQLSFENKNRDSLEIRDLLTAIDKGEQFAGVETTLITRRRKISILLFYETLPAMHGREPARLLMFQDISTIKQAQKDLASALQGRDQFMAALSHELRTPINVILGWVELLRAHLDDKTIVKQALDTLARNAELQRDLIENLLDMSRIITGGLNLQLQPLDLKTAVGEWLTSLLPKSKEKNITLQANIVAESAIVLADSKRIQQLIFNLVQNAIKFTQQNGKIVVHIATDSLKCTACLSVQDNGQGIDPTFLPHVFDQFKQENMSTNRTYGGLGLAICKTIVVQHHGEIKVKSDGKGKGSIFFVELPLYTQKKEFTSQTNSKIEKINLSGVRVLLVDDSVDNLTLFSIWLKKNGAEIKTLESASKVIETIEAFKPNVLLSDISMPGEDGYALIAKVRALPFSHGSEIPAGALTANARLEDRNQTLAAGYHMHIPKPVTENGLLRAIKFLLEIGHKNIDKNVN